MADISFERHLFELLAEKYPKLRSFELLETLGQLPYEEELQYKKAAMKAFCATNRVQPAPTSLMPSITKKLQDYY